MGPTLMPKVSTVEPQRLSVPKLAQELGDDLREELLKHTDVAAAVTNANGPLDPSSVHPTKHLTKEIVNMFLPRLKKVLKDVGYKKKVNSVDEARFWLAAVVYAIEANSEPAHCRQI